MASATNPDFIGGGRLTVAAEYTGPSFSLTFFTVYGNFFAVADPSVSGTVNLPVVQPVQALVTFTPRLDFGEQIFVNNYLITNAYNAEQTVNLIGNPTGGTFTLQFGGATTTPIAWDATPAQVQTALAALPTIGAGNVIVVVDPSPQAYDVEFTNIMGNQYVPPLNGDASGLVNAEGQGFCEVTVATTALGSPQVVGPAAISLPAITARIFNGVLSTIDYADTPGIQLVANTPELGLTTPLIYDVTFTNITFNKAPQVLAPFAFTAPSTATTIELSSPTLVHLPYQQPSGTMWTPGAGGVATPLRALGSGPRANWRQRAIASGGRSMR